MTYNVSTAVNIFIQMTQSQFQKLRKGDLLVPSEGSALPAGTYWFLAQAWADGASAVVLDGAGITKERTVAINQVDLDASVVQTGLLDIYPAEHWTVAVGLGNPVMLSVRVLEAFTDFPNPLIYHGHEVINGEVYVKVGEPDRILGFLLASIVKLVPYVP